MNKNTKKLLFNVGMFTIVYGLFMSMACVFISSITSDHWFFDMAVFFLFAFLMGLILSVWTAQNGEEY